MGEKVDRKLSTKNCLKKDKLKKKRRRRTHLDYCDWGINNLSSRVSRGMRGDECEEGSRGGGQTRCGGIIMEDCSHLYGTTGKDTTGV
jgi:hypothetical protein